MRNLLLALIAMLLLGCASGARAALTPQSSLDEILDALDHRGQGLQGFTADVKLSDTDAALGDESTRVGKVWYQANPPRIRVTFDTRESGGRSTAEKLEYLLAGTDLIDRNYRTKVQATYHVLKPGQKFDLFKLGQGPFPLPIGQKKEDVHAQFEAAKIEPKKEDPPQTVHVQLIPKPGTNLARRFKTIDVWVDLTNDMPKRIETMDTNQTSIRTTELSNVQVNPKLGDGDFALSKVSEGEWQLREEAFNP